MSIPTDRLREIADGAMGIGAPLVLTQAEQVAVCTELLALRDATSLPGYTRLVEERDAARAEAEKLRDEVTQLEGMERQRDEAYATLDDVCKALGADVDSAVAQALMLKEKAGELAAVKRQRDALVDALRDAEEVLALMERPRQEDPAYGAEVRALGARIGFGALMSSASASWRKALPEGLGGEHVPGPCRGTVDWILKRVRDAIAAEQPKPIEPAPCACCDKPASHIGSDGRQRCSEHTLNGDQPVGGA